MLLAFVVPAVATVVSPGPDTILVLRFAIGSGARAGLVAVTGVQLGLVVHTLLAAGGISVIIATSPLLFRAVTMAGAAYLAWLGWQGLRGGGMLSLGGGNSGGSIKALRESILCNILNPKVILLFLALFPHFVDAERSDVPEQLVTLAATLLVINVLWLAPLVLIAHFARRWLDRPSVQVGVARSTGAIFIGFAIVLIYEHAL